MKLFTRIERPDYPFDISYTDKLMFLGSCFSDNIGGRFAEVRFQALCNPFGVIFNPYSLFNLLERVVDGRLYTEADWIYFNERWINLELHGDHAYADRETALQSVNDLMLGLREELKSLDHLFITFGTSWVYEYLENGLLVANCHKIPQKQFAKRMLTVQDIELKGVQALEKVRRLNPRLKLIFTVSPVRHLKDGAHENQISKSSLLLGIEGLRRHFDESFYFPSYELMMDEMRDYRYYAKDLVHPSELAVDYIWEEVQQAFLDEFTLRQKERIGKLQKALQHRPFHTQSEAYRKFLDKTQRQFEQLRAELPFIDWSEEEKALSTKYDIL